MACNGTVKFFNDQKGFGFISSQNGDIFVHANDVSGNPLQEGDEVAFDEQFDQMKQKTRAANVTGGTGSPQQKGGGGGKGGGGYGAGKGGGFGAFGGGGYGGKAGGYGGGYDGGYGGGPPQQGYGGGGFGD